LEIGAIPDGIPDRVNLQTSYGSYLARRDGEQTSKPLNGFLRCARTRFDFGQSNKEKRTGKRISFDRQ
jgi:hypothetical protein